LTGEHIRIQLPVICLQNGRLGQTIRVTSKDRRQTFSAEVVGPVVLNRRLQ
jgi:flagella basal body P-ring formation protein FlgA